jgi:radical SAM superfamily enzyme YgiQ (UPF0313 family)
MNRRLDVLFLIPAALSAVYQILAKEHAIEPPAKARFMASYLMRRGRGVDILDAAPFGLNPKDMAEQVRLRNPKLVVIPVYGFNPSSSTQTMPAARAYAQAVKDECPKIPVMMTGTHPAALPERTLREEPIDYVCVGEGPITVDELLQAIDAGSMETDLEKVRSLWRLKIDGSLACGFAAPLIDLNKEFIVPDAWRLTPPTMYRAHEWHTFYRPYQERGPYANPYSREGCPFSCDFCNIQAPFRDGETLLSTKKNSFRDLSPKLFVQEVEFLVKEFGAKYFKIPDEMFGAGEHPLRIAELIAERFQDSLNFWCYYRVDTCKPKHLDILRNAGFRWFGLGIEAANSEVREGQDKGFTDERIHDVVQRIHGAGIEVGANYIFGLPGETRASMEETRRLAFELNTAFANFYCNQALPGSPQYVEAVRNGYALPAREGGPGWIGHSQYAKESEPYCGKTNLSPAEVLRFRDETHVAYYRRSVYMERLRNDPKFGNIALTTIERWIENVDCLKRDLLAV